MKCSKSGIKIHESNNNTVNVDQNDAQFEFFNKIKEKLTIKSTLFLPCALI